MSSTIDFTITDKGLEAVFNAKNTGLDLELTHIQLGSGKKTPDGKETSLLAPKQTQAIGFGSHPQPNQISMTVAFSVTTSFDVSEIGVWAGDPGSAGSVLFAYWSMSAGSLVTTTPGVDFVFTHDLVVDASTSDVINIVVDPDASIFELHMTGADPHPQYAKLSDFEIEIGGGYAKFPNGLILQGGILELPATNQTYTGANFNFPISFEDGATTIVASATSIATANKGFIGIPVVFGISKSECHITIDTNGASIFNQPQKVYWFAAGI